MTKTPGRFIWYELLTTDPKAAAKFYGDVVGWTVNAIGGPHGDYHQWAMGDGAVGGMMTIPAPTGTGSMAPCWLGYINTPDVDQTAAAIAEAGGSVHMPPFDIPGVGRSAMVGDPQGAIFYVMAPIGEGESTVFSPGVLGHGGWHELHTSDEAKGFAFYAAQFGWKASEAFDMGPMGKYQLFNAGAGDLGGMMTNTNVPRPMWLYYFNVDDINAALKRVEAAGGTVTNGPHEVPTGLWMLQATDPQGATFALLAPK